MKNYKHILVAIELIKKNDSELISHAVKLVKDHGADITLVHAVEQVSSYNAYGIGISFDVEKSLLEIATKEMCAFGGKLGIPEKRQIVKIGPAKFIILEEADRIKANLIIVGSHGRHGLRTILGSTANGVLHGARCDVLAVRFKN